MDYKTWSSTLITEKEIRKIQNLLGTALRKSGLLREPTQWVIETQAKSLVEELVAAVCRRVEVVRDLIFCRVTVDCTRSPQEMLKATRRYREVNRNVLANMPRGEGKKVDVYFFSVARSLSNYELEQEYTRRSLKPADPYTLAAVNETIPSIANCFCTGTQWKDAAGEWCYMLFYRLDCRRRGVIVDRCSSLFEWEESCLFAGLRK